MFPDPGSYSSPQAFLRGLFSYAARQYEAARQANEARYQQILSGYGALQRDVMGQLSKIGAASRAELERQFSGMQSNVYQGLIDRGLAKSTVWPTLQAGLGRQYGYALADLHEKLAQQRAMTLAKLGEARLGFMERRTDEYPDMNTLLALGTQIGRGIGMFGGGGYGAYRSGPTMSVIRHPLGMTHAAYLDQLAEEQRLRRFQQEHRIRY